MKHEFSFGTVGAPISTPQKPGGSLGAITRLAELGLNTLELGWVQSVRVSEQTCELIRLTSHSSLVKISVHAPYFINLNADDEEWPKSRKRLMDAAHYGNLAGATDIVFHPGSYFGKKAAEVLPIAISRLQGCMDELRQNGNPVTLRPETMGKSAMLGSLSDCVFMSREVPGVLPCIDFAHLHARNGNGSFNSYKEWIEVISFYAKALGDDALTHLHIHLSGIEYSEKGERNHLPIQESDMNLDALLTALRDMRCGGRILCESPIMEDDAIHIKSRWLELIG